MQICGLEPESLTIRRDAQPAASFLLSTELRIPGNYPWFRQRRTVLLDGFRNTKLQECCRQFAHLHLSASAERSHRRTTRQTLTSLRVQQDRRWSACNSSHQRRSAIESTYHEPRSREPPSCERPYPALATRI